MTFFEDHAQVNESSTQPFQATFNDNSDEKGQSTVDMDICKHKEHISLNVPSLEERSFVEGKESAIKKTTTYYIPNEPTHSTDNNIAAKDRSTVSDHQLILNNEATEDQSPH